MKGFPLMPQNTRATRAVSLVSGWNTLISLSLEYFFMTHLFQVVSNFSSLFLFFINAVFSNSTVIKVLWRSYYVTRHLNLSIKLLQQAHVRCNKGTSKRGKSAFGTDGEGYLYGIQQCLPLFQNWYPLETLEYKILWKQGLCRRRQLRRRPTGSGGLQIQQLMSL